MSKIFEWHWQLIGFYTSIVTIISKTDIFSRNTHGPQNKVFWNSIRKGWREAGKVEDEKRTNVTNCGLWNEKSVISYSQQNELKVLIDFESGSLGMKQKRSWRAEIGNHRWKILSWEEALVMRITVLGSWVWMYDECMTEDHCEHLIWVLCQRCCLYWANGVTVWR